MDFIMRDSLDIIPMSIYVNDNSMANIISLREVADYFRVAMDTEEDHALLVHYSTVIIRLTVLRNVERAYIILTSLTQKSSH